MGEMILNRARNYAPSLFSLVMHVLVIGVVAYNIKTSESIELPPQQMVTVTLMKAEYFEEKKPQVVKQQAAPIVNQAEAVKPQRQERPVVKQKVSEPQQVAKLETKAGKKAADMVVTKPVFDADYLNNPPPVYPNSAKRKRQQGNVLLMVLVSENGSASQVKLHSSSGSEVLDNAAIAAVSKWKFVPAKREGEFVVASVIVPIDFRLR